jgi:hypothetical protein
MQNFILRTASVVALSLATLGLQAQALTNCGAPASAAGTLTATGSTTLAPGDLISPPSLSGYSAGLPNREYALFDANTIVFNGDSTISGPLFVSANLTGAFNPGALGFGDGDDLCVRYVSYDRTVIRNAVDELLNGSFLFTPCCNLIPTFVPDIGDVCSLLNAAGINGPSDVNNLNDVFNVVIALGGSGSLESLVDVIDNEINTLVASGTPCTGGSALCYSSTAAVCYSIEAAGCSTAVPPTGQSHTVLSNRVELQWVPNAGAVACQVNGKRLPSGPQPVQNVSGSVINKTNVPFSVAGAGTTWTWRVRCACTVTPTITATAYSPYGDTFSVPAAREADMIDLNSVFPNPAQNQVSLQIFSAESADVQLVVSDLMGRVVVSRQVNLVAGQHIETLDVSSLPNGMYFARMGNAPALTFEVMR